MSAITAFHLRGDCAYHKNTEGPPVSCEGMPLPVDHFWCHVLDSAAEREGLLVRLLEGLFAETEIRQRYVTVCIEENAAI